jgi:hypothetical protein
MHQINLSHTHISLQQLDKVCYYLLYICATRLSTKIDHILKNRIQLTKQTANTGSPHRNLHAIAGCRHYSGDAAPMPSAMAPSCSRARSQDYQRHLKILTFSYPCILEFFFLITPTYFLRNTYKNLAVLCAFIGFRPNGCTPTSSGSSPSPLATSSMGRRCVFGMIGGSLVALPIIRPSVFSHSFGPEIYQSLKSYPIKF